MRRKSTAMPDWLPDYAELHALSNFTFLRGASSARELFERARRVGYRALAITDECTLAGIVRAYEAAKETGIELIVGSEIALAGGPRVVLLAATKAGYTALCALITAGRRAAAKGSYHVTRADLAELPRDGLLALLLDGDTVADADAAWLGALFPERCWIAVELHRGGRDAERLATLRALGARTCLPLVASGDVHMHVRTRKALQDVLTATRLGTTVAEAGKALFPNGERHLRPRDALGALYPPDLLAETLAVAARCTFTLDELRYEYPRELVPHGLTPAAHLRALTEAGLAFRFPAGTPDKVRAQVEHELALIAELKYESYFLTVHDIVAYARSRNILCQGRGSAANSAVCFALGVTEVDPARMNMLFERFISKERNEPPDIDIDFEHERREEVIQYIYRKYGRHRAALAATVICYRSKSAVRDVGKALGMSLDQVDAIAKTLGWWDGAEHLAERLVEQGFDPAAPLIRKLLRLTAELVDFPRHLSQHVGGFVISERPLSELVPVENAAMPERTVIQWDKDDLDTLGLLKVDCLALGMLTCLHRCLDLVKRHRGVELTLATIPAEDPETYAMIQQADTLGTFQIESRAQMSMLPRLKPATFYDLVIEIAIVRPGPVQGKMVHPFLRRRQGREPVEYPSEALREVFGRTLGVPIFQEQVMQLAIVAAGFTPGEADQLRRSMAAWKRRGGMEHFQRRILDGMTERGYTAEFAAQVFEQIQGFASYGFPESHSASFALIAYASCWLKRHEPAAFACALLNSQPMGFYAPAQIVQDVKRHGVRVLPVDVRYSEWDCTLEAERRATPDARAGAAHGRDRDLAHTESTADRGSCPYPHRGGYAIRLGLRQIRGLSEALARRIVAARAERPFADVQDLAERAALGTFERTRLADAGALRGLAGHRHRARWAAAGAERQAPLFAGTGVAEDGVRLAPPTAAQNVWSDYRHLGLTLDAHPLALLRRRLAERRVRTAQDLKRIGNAPYVRTAGLVTIRQRPATASGVTFVTMEDETGATNVVVWRDLGERSRRVLNGARLLGVDGKLELVDGVQHVIALRLHDYSGLLGALDARSRDFR